MDLSSTTETEGWHAIKWVASFQDLLIPFKKEGDIIPLKKRKTVSGPNHML